MTPYNQLYDVIVLGAGGVGSAAMYHLARRRVRVLGIDSARPPHSYGSSHGQTRVIRQAYFEHPNYVPLLRESYRLWHELERTAGKHLFHQIGLVEIGPAEGVVVPGVLRAAEEHHLAVEPMSAAEIELRWPGLRVGDGLSGVFEPTAGFLLVEDCVEAHLAAAQDAGAELLIDDVVEGLEFGKGAWSADDQEVVVHLINGTVRAKKLVIAAGASAGRMLADLSLGLKVLRKPLFWFKSDAPQYDNANGLPVYLFELPHGIFYGFPKLDQQGIKVAEHTGGREFIGDSRIDNAIDSDEQSRLIEFLKLHLPGVRREVTDHTVCRYTMSRDEHFIVDRHPAHPNVVFAAGLSGHGFKFTPVLGQILADLTLDGGTKSPIDFLSLQRFS